MFHETIVENPNENFRVLICVIYTMIENYVCIDYVACQFKKISEISMGSKHVENISNRILGIGIPDF